MFYSVNHTKLLHKLEKIGFSGKLFNWLREYLHNRSQRVVLNGCTSEWVPVTSGVPQGSILGPLLFLLFINDMPDSAKNSILAMFADDAKCFRRIVNIDDCIALQKDLDELYRWSNYWKLNFNSSKCKIISFTRNHNPIKFDYAINGEPLENVSSFCDLGVTVYCFLTHNVHIHNIINKCNKVNGKIRRAVGYKAPASVTLNMYKALIRPIAEYSSSLWSPFYKSHIESVERIQRNFTRYGMHYPLLNYKERCEIMNLLPLSFRREMADIKLLYESMYKTNFSNNISELVKTYTPNPHLHSSRKGLLLQPQQLRTETYKGFCTNRIVTLWNQLPPALRVDQSFSIFVNELEVFYLKKFNDTFMCNNVCSWTSTCRCQACACF